MDQDPDGARALSAVIAARVFKEPESDRSRLIAEAMIAEFARCVDATENAVLSAYQQRLIRQTLMVQIEKLDDLERAVTGVQRTLTDTYVRIDPEVLLSGPLEGLKLTPDYQAVLDCERTDPGAAAVRLWAIIGRIEETGQVRLARTFRVKHADLLVAARQYAQAADAWLPMVEDYLTAGHGYGRGASDAVNSWAAMANHDDAPAWLHPRRAAVLVLEHCWLGDRPASAALQAAITAADAADPAASTWLMHAAEACLADDDLDEITTHRERLLAAAAATTTPMIAARLKLAVADATNDETIWEQLLATAAPGAPGYKTELAALIHARRARNLFRCGKNGASVAEYRRALGEGTHARHWQDAASWTNSACHVLTHASSIALDDVKALQEQGIALREAGPGSLLDRAYDPRATALMKLVDVTATKGPARSARIDLRRYLRRSIILGELTNELEAHRLLGRLYQQTSQPESALAHHIAAGDATGAGEAAAKLAKYCGCLDAAQSPVAGTRAAALRAAARQADLIPDALVAQWARTALGEAKRGVCTFGGRDPYLSGYEVLEALSARFPDDMVLEFLEVVDPLLPRDAGTYRPMDDQISRILIGLARHNPLHRPAVADRLATVFEIADDLADTIADSAHSISESLMLVKTRLKALLAADPDRHKAKILNAARALVEVGDQSEELLAVVDREVEAELDSQVAYTARIAGVEETAILAACLPAERQSELARHNCARVLDENNSESNRASYTSACRISAEYLPGSIRDDLFGQLLPLLVDGVNRSPIDQFTDRYKSPFGALRIKTATGMLRREIAKTLAMLATNQQDQERAWRATQQLSITGEPKDVNTVARVGYVLARQGYTSSVPWDVLACSPDPDMRHLAAALVPLAPHVDVELITRLARDEKTAVRSELATAIAAIKAGAEDDSIDERLLQICNILSLDPSHRVRSALNVVEQ
ncbi:hypothetical protein [Mycobacteroides abscessus]|uniref:hypothetical protein n=1 Tax=Mycobacteroides abscessus TaxID=36809 RepID=UPI00036529C4|nr:hypothetical protein [Mycobacteroides abscessus]